MYEIKKQIEIANLSCGVFELNTTTYVNTANNLFFGIDDEKKEKLLNYVKILVMSSKVKNKMNVKYPVCCIKKYKNFSASEITSMFELSVAILSTYELCLNKSKELVVDLRLKLIEELVNAIEINNRELIKECHRTVTNIIENDIEIYK